MNGDIKLNQWYKCLVYKRNQLKYIKFFGELSNNDTIIGGVYIQNNNFIGDGAWYLSNLKIIKEVNLPIVCELFDSEDSSNIIIALEILKQNL